MGGEKRIEKFRVQDKQNSVILGGNVKMYFLPWVMEVKKV